MQTELQPSSIVIPSRRVCAAFTMIEIAIALAIIGFALVAIVGVLPAGLNVQKENREETILNQDGPFLLEAIRSGAQGFDDLTNYVQSISVMRLPGVSNYYVFNGSPGYTSGARIIALLSIPKYTGNVTNLVTARIRAFSGGVTERSGSDLAFTYQLTSEIVPYTSIPNSDFLPGGATNGGGVFPPEVMDRVERGYVANELAANLFEVRLLFQWPLLPDGRTGNSRQTYRSLIASFQTNEASGVVFQPQTFRRTTFP